ncbi:MAG: GNAT family N-acetyltransferase [Clostridia bacterium]|nr:GNAT family N-acetyltransferase [Clostridia bacterium]
MEITIKKFDELTTDELYEILRLRAEVFVVEQDCVYQDLDGKDKKAYHIYLTDDGVMQAYLRVLPQGVSYPLDASIGRVVVRAKKNGYGKIVVERGLKLAKEKFNAKVIRISAQVQAQGFYEKQGFKPVSNIYLEDGIDHREMIYEVNS